jgi:hypothetical protein
MSPVLDHADTPVERDLHFFRFGEIRKRRHAKKVAAAHLQRHLVESDPTASSYLMTEVKITCVLTLASMFARIGFESRVTPNKPFRSELTYFFAPFAVPPSPNNMRVM